MKKVLALILAVCLMFSLAVTAGAATKGSSDISSNDAVSGDKSNPVKVNVTGVAGSAATVYYLEIKWDPLIFTYNYKETGKVYDPEDHTETVTTSGTAGWQHTEAADITVTNHSNASVTVSASIAESKVKGVEAVLTGDEQILESAVGKAMNAPELVASFTVNVTGTPDKANTAEAFTVDTVTITIS